MFLAGVGGGSFRCIDILFHKPLLRCCHISPDNANGRRTERKNAKNVYPVENRHERTENFTVRYASVSAIR